MVGIQVRELGELGEGWGPDILMGAGQEVSLDVCRHNPTLFEGDGPQAKYSILQCEWLRLRSAKFVC